MSQDNMNGVNFLDGCCLIYREKLLFWGRLLTIIAPTLAFIVMGTAYQITAAANRILSQCFHWANVSIIGRNLAIFPLNHYQKVPGSALQWVLQWVLQLALWWVPGSALRWVLQWVL
jgi:hypothetical protein